MNDLNSELDSLLKTFNDVNSKLNEIAGIVDIQNTRIDELSKEVENLTKEKVCEEYKNGQKLHKDFLINYAVEVLLQKTDKDDFMKKYMKLILTDDKKVHFDKYINNKVNDRVNQWWLGKIQSEINNIKESYEKYKDCELFKQDVILKLCEFDSKWTEDSVRFIENNITLLPNLIIPKNIETINSGEYAKILRENMDPLFFENLEIGDFHIGDFDISDLDVPTEGRTTRNTSEKIKQDIFDKVGTVEQPDKKRQRRYDGYKKSSKRKSSKRKSTKRKSSKRK